jgi:two-component system chemotaxis response regulator CheB
VDVLFHSVAHTFGSKSVGVLMTGMGEDGAAGMGAIQAAGGVTLAQSPDTCVVDSMPRSAISRGFAGRVVSLPHLASTLQSKCLPDRPAAEPAEVPSGATAGDSGSRRRSP